jgi:hypothetical protein
MVAPIPILILGASYGSLLATKLLLAGHDVHLVCLQSEADLINAEGTRVRMPVKGRSDLVEVDSRKLPGRLTASAPDAVDPAGYALVVLAMQEPQYGAEGVRQLVDRVATGRIPCMSIMNMPPLPYLTRILGSSAADLAGCYADASVWRNFDPDLMTLCSPDPQAFRPPEEKTNVLQVRLPTNFKAARFADAAQTDMLRRLQIDIEAVRFDPGDGSAIELPVKLKVFESVHVPLAKWAMLLAGNYRCVQANGVRPIREAIHSDLAASREVYEWVVDLCIALGADRSDMVPFEKYAAAAESLGSPSSAARALAAGAQRIERVDLLVQTIGAKLGRRSAALDATVATVDQWLARNRKAAA